MKQFINDYHEKITENTLAKVRQSFREQQVELFISYTPIGNTMIGKWIKRSFHYIYKLYVIVKYTVYRKCMSIYQNRWRLLFRLTFIVFAFFTLSEKDIQFSLNFRSPVLGSDNNMPLTERLTSNPVQVAMVSNLNSFFNVKTLDKESVQVYVKRFSRVAVIEMEKYGIPASLKMAQAIIGSHAGQNEESELKNNHFGLQLSGQYYKNAWENWRTHSIYLKDNFSSLFSNGRNYKKWALALSELNYSKDPEYAEKLLYLIENYQLYLLDEI